MSETEEDRMNAIRTSWEYELSLAGEILDELESKEALIRAEFHARPAITAENAAEVEGALTRLALSAGLVKDFLGLRESEMTAAESAVERSGHVTAR